jgi:hypothetical protein
MGKGSPGTASKPRRTPSASDRLLHSPSRVALLLCDIIYSHFMEAKQSNNVHKEAHQTDKLYIENTLLRVSAALFCHDPKRAATCMRELEFNRSVTEKNIVIRPDSKLGQPGQLAHKVFIALIKKHSDYGRPVQKSVSFTRREIGRLIGRKQWGGRDSEQFSRALHEIHYTFIKTHFQNREGQRVEHSFNVSPEIFLERREFVSDPIEACTITLAEPIVASLQDEHFTCLNHALMTGLGTIGQALYMRLFFHFANLYDGHNSRQLAFQKRYDDICTEWLGGLTILEHKSKIIGEQLGRHLDDLAQTRFLASYLVGKAKSREGFILTFRPGVKFFEDYERFYRLRHQSELQRQAKREHQQIGEPLKVAYLFAQKRTGHPVASIAFVPTKDVATAKQLLAAIASDEISAFLDYALAEARKTNFDVQFRGCRYFARKNWRPSVRASKLPTARSVFLLPTCRVTDDPRLFLIWNVMGYALEAMDALITRRKLSTPLQLAADRGPRNRNI